MDAGTRQDDEKFVHVVGVTEGQKVYSVARPLTPLKRMDRTERAKRGDVKKKSRSVLCTGLARN
jgi:hypothetical protein